MFSYHICPNCARSYRSESREKVIRSKEQHTCLSVPHDLEPTMKPFEEYEWADAQLKKAGGVRV